MNFYTCLTGVLRALLKVFMFFKIKGKENVPAEGGFLLCVNHKSYMDAVMVAASCPRQLTFMAKEELFKVFLFGKFIKAVGAFPIKRGKGDAAAVMATLKIMKRGGATLIFPEGTRMKNGARKEVNHGIIRLAMQCNVPIIPAGVYKNTITYGKAISYSAYSDRMNDSELMQSLANSLMDNIYSLASAK